MSTRKKKYRKRRSKEEIWKMCWMRFEGYSHKEIARAFGCDHSTVVYHCQKYKVARGVRGFLPSIDFSNNEEVRIAIESDRKNSIRQRKAPPHKYGKRIFASVNRGKNYEEYLRDNNLKRGTTVYGDPIYVQKKTKRIRCKGGLELEI